MKDTKVEVIAEVAPVVAEAAPMFAEVAAPVVAALPPAETPEEEKKEEEQETVAAVDPLMAQVAEMAKCMGEVQASVKELQETVAGLKSEVKAHKVTARRLMLKASMSDEDFYKDQETLVSMDDKAFNLFVASKQSSKLTLAAGVRLPEPVAGGTKQPLTLK